MKKKAEAPEIKVELTPEKPETVRVLAKAITDIADGFNKLQNAGLNRRALVVLISDIVGGRAYKYQIEAVLDALPQLGKMYVVKK